MADTTIEVAALNIVASPHPTGTYLRLLQHVAGKEIVTFAAGLQLFLTAAIYNAKASLDAKQKPSDGSSGQ